MTTLYEQNPTAWDKMAVNGRVSLTEMAKRFTTVKDMDSALGLDGATRHWHRGDALAGMGTERAAAMWLKLQTTGNSTPEPTPEPKPATQGRVLMVVCNDATADRAMKMLAILGCEVVEV